MSVPEGVVCNARDHGLAGDGVTNDQPALQALVDALGAAYAADGQAQGHLLPARHLLDPGHRHRVAQRNLPDRGRDRRHQIRPQQRGEPGRSDPARLLHRRAARREPGEPHRRLHLRQLRDRRVRRATGPLRLPRQGAGPAVRAARAVPGPLHPRHRRDRARLRLPPGHGGGGGERVALWAARHRAAEGRCRHRHRHRRLGGERAAHHHRVHRRRQRDQRHLPGVAAADVAAAARHPHHRLSCRGQPVRHLRLGRGGPDRHRLHHDRQP